MKKLLAIFFCLFLFASSVCADCSNLTPPFGATPAEVAEIVTKWFGPPEKVTSEFIRWDIPAVERSSFVAVFVERKLSGILIFTAAPSSPEMAEGYLKLTNGWEKNLTEEGFTFAKEGKNDSHGIKSVYKEYECRKDKRVRVRMSLGKDTASKLISAELYTYWNGNKEK
jgi:hypothetical protein